jgi:diguanylate cyclase (GGDEF)-like protein
MSNRYSDSSKRPYVDGAAPCLIDGTAAPRPNFDPDVDPDAVVSAGEVSYDWRLDSDLISWGRNVGDVLGISDPAGLATGTAFAQWVVPGGGPTRADVVKKPPFRDEGRGVAYQLRYPLRSPGRVEPTWIEDTGRWFGGPDGNPLRAHGVVRVINERHEREQHLVKVSQFDALTGEMNRWRLAATLSETIEETIKLRSSCGFFLAAVDNLARINDAYGFDIADEVITGIGKRLRAKLRGKDHLGRFSGNKFGIILNNCTPDDMLITADRLLSGVRDKVMPTSAGPVAVTVTLGGAIAPRHARTVRDVMIRAQEALDGAKVKRRGSFQGYTPNLSRDAQRHENIRATQEIIGALNARRIFLVYEPVVGTRSRQPEFYECLMRVGRQDGSLMAVNEAIGLAERLGLIGLLDHRVLELAVQELIAAPALRASLNVSAASTGDAEWWSALAATLGPHHGVAERLTVEITETAAIQDIDETRNFVKRVKDLGCRIAMDDFGAGYTSFRNLRKLGVDIVKIDGAFVRNITKSEDDRAFVQTLIDLAQRLRIKTVAEWVPDELTATILADWGCDYLQGALVGLAAAERPWLDVGAAIPKAG